VSSWDDGAEWITSAKKRRVYTALWDSILRIILPLAGLSDNSIVNQPFPIQFRLRLQKLGPTYIKLGQILSLREDLLPKAITDELKNSR
jgi:predicted unusual protein kinase regulating ubiquinone biosynthesis (AarF/ABC1/UbiB family)